MREWISHDVRFAARSLRLSPGFSAAVVCTLALGIGANAAIFGIADAVLLRTVPVREAHQLYFVAHGTGATPALSSTYPLLSAYRALSDVFSGVTAYTVRELKVSTESGLDAVAGQYVSGSYHDVLGVPFALGRGFASEPDRPADRNLVAVISEQYWARAFGRDRNILGRTLTVDGHTVTIVGVTAEGFHGLRPGTRFDITLPLAVRVRSDAGLLDRHETWTGLNIVARLAPGVSEPRALQRVNTVFQQYMAGPHQARMRRDGQLPEAFRAARLVPASRGTWGLRTQYDRSLRVLLAMVGLLLLITCANVAHLMLVRSAGRRKEIAIRTSLGATRLRLARQLLTESLLLAACGGGIGLLVSVWAATAIASLFRVGPFPVTLDIELDARLFAFTAALSVLTGLAFGVLPAMRGSSPDVIPALKAGGATHREGLGRLPAGSVLMIGQVALAVLLLAASGALVRSLHTLNTLESGFAKENVLLFYLDATVSASDPRDLQAGLLERLGALSGVRAAALATASPLATDEETRPLEIPGATLEGEHRVVPTNRVSPDYFSVFGIPLLRGRGFEEQDSAAAPRVAIVSETMARTYFGEGDPIGRTFVFSSAREHPVTIVGVVRDVRHQSLRRPAPRLVYVPLAQAEEPPALVTAAVRTIQSPRAVEREARAAAVGVDRNLLVSYVRTLEDQMAASLVRERLLAWLSAGFGTLALILACVGLYGVMAHHVRRRARELGIRMALGATPASVLRHTLHQALLLSGTGIVIGLLAASIGGSLLGALVFGLSPRDPVTLLAASAALLTTSLLAAYGPARRAASTDPMSALRSE